MAAIKNLIVTRRVGTFLLSESIVSDILRNDETFFSPPKRESLDRRKIIISYSTFIVRRTEIKHGTSQKRHSLQPHRIIVSHNDFSPQRKLARYGASRLGMGSAISACACSLFLLCSARILLDFAEMFALLFRHALRQLFRSSRSATIEVTFEIGNRITFGILSR